MKRIIAALLMITALFTLASCGSTYKVEGEKEALKVYSCSCNNMLGLEKIVSESSVRRALKKCAPGTLDAWLAGQREN